MVRPRRVDTSFMPPSRALLLPARGEKVGMRGRGRAFRLAVLRIAERPPHPRFARPLPARRGEVNKRKRSRDASAPSLANKVMPTTTRKKKDRGGGAPKGACHPLSALQSATLLLPTSPRTRANGARSPSGASPRTRHASRAQTFQRAPRKTRDPTRSLASRSQVR